MPRYSLITVIYNPKSTGQSQQLAERFLADIKRTMPDQPIVLAATEYAGHAEALAYQAACESKAPLIISASGDGGYHEVVNGVMRAHTDGCQPTTGLLPAGNANDHYGAMHVSDLLDAVRKGEARQVDLLKLKSSIDGQPHSRYAHSYIGFGLTPKVGLELNKTNLTWYKEIHIVAKVLFFLRPVRLIVDGSERRYDSLICSNIRKMSKILSLSKQAEPDDGLFEITVFRRRSKVRLIYTLLRASTRGLDDGRQVTSYRFRSTAPLLVQLDGEVKTIDADSDVLISCERQSLRCVI